MWTYMMAAARGDRVNSMVSNRRRPEIESPKYGYTTSRPMYRTRRHSGSSSNTTTTATLGTTPTQYAISMSSGDDYGTDSGRGTVSGAHDAIEMFHTNTFTAVTAVAQQHQPPPTTPQAPPPPQRLRLQASSRATSPNDVDIYVGESDGGSLYAPFTPTATLTCDKDMSVYNCKDPTICMVRKHLIANQSNRNTHTRSIHIPMHDNDLDKVSDYDAAVSSMIENDSSCSRNFRQQQIYDRHYCQQQRELSAVGGGQNCRQSGCCPAQLENGINVNNDIDNDDLVEDDDEISDESEIDEAAAATTTSAAKRNYHENGKKLPQDASRQTKPSILRRTLNSLRQRLNRRSRTKPPDWFLEKFSNTTNTDKIGKTAASATDVDLSSEIRGTSVLCNRLSVNTTLQSHYRWLSIVSLAVLYNIIFVVGRAVFWEINKSSPRVWYFLDYLCDFIYLLDTLVHMHEGYLDQGLLVRDAYKLRRHYFHTKGWYIDVLSMLPTDLAYIWWPPETCSHLYLPCPVIVRLNRLLRLPRLWEWFDRTETATGYPNAFRICKVVLAILVLIHWNACMYFAISYELGFSSDNWVYNLNGSRNNTLRRQYIYSFYWSTLTLTTIGETPTPENDVEYLFVVADFLAGVLIFATIVGNIGSMISNMNVARVEFQNRMDGVKQYMAFRKVGHELEARVIRWFAYTWSQSGALDEERVLSALPDKLKAEIAIQVHMDTLKQVRIFHDTEPGLLEALVLKLKLQVFSPGDYICRKGDVGKEMYIVKRGKLSVVADDGITVLATLGAGSVFGEVSVLEIAGNRTGNRRTANVRSLGYSDLFCLAKRDLWETLADYPEARSTLTQRGCQLLRKDGLLDEQVFADSQRVHDSIESGIERLEVSVENLNVRLARLLAEYTASQAKIKQRLAKLELNNTPTNGNTDTQQRVRSGRLYSLQPKRRPRQRTALAAKSTENKQNTL